MPRKPFAKRMGVKRRTVGPGRRAARAKDRPRAAGKPGAKWHIKKALAHLTKAHNKMQAQAKRQADRRRAG